MSSNPGGEKSKWGPGTLIQINFFSVPDTHDEHCDSLVAYFVNDPIINTADSVYIVISELFVYGSFPHAWGIWTPRFENLFIKAGMTLDNPLNIVPVYFHQGPHPEAYHKAILQRLQDAVKGENAGSKGYRDKFQFALF